MPADSPTSSTGAVLVTINALPDDRRAVRAIESAVALMLGVPLDEARAAMSTLPVTLPLRLSDDEANAFIQRFEKQGLRAEAASRAALESCSEHPRFDAWARCTKCEVPICVVCAPGGQAKPLCVRCRRKGERSRVFFFARVTVLLVILAGVVLYAYRDVESRKARTEWKRTLDIAIVLVERAPVDRAATAAVRSRAPDLEAALEAEMRRYRKDGPTPFHVKVFGPVPLVRPPPTTAGEGITADARYAWDLWRFTSDVDDRVELTASDFDTRIYLVISPPKDVEKKLIEGASQQGGRVGVVDVELDDAMADFALFVAAHELFHTLGASDKYDPTGRIAVPDGLAEPDQVPIYPQRFVELMARHRPIDEARSKPPKSLAELRVGAATAREIGWR
ncbi:MAG: hypothetical protein U0271_35735 [Polyangiaceae bacterium]